MPRGYVTEDYLCLGFWVREVVRAILRNTKARPGYGHACIMHPQGLGITLPALPS